MKKKQTNPYSVVPEIQEAWACGFRCIWRSKTEAVPSVFFVPAIFSSKLIVHDTHFLHRLDFWSLIQRKGYFAIRQGLLL